MRRDHPDTPKHVKARALIEFGKWRQNWVRSVHGFIPQLLFWIDIACVDQAHPRQDLAKLPLAIACCERLLTFVAQGYEDRGWCRVEQLLAKRFMYADHQNVIDEHFVNPWPYKGKSVAWQLHDPAKGDLSCESDRAHISDLTRAACVSRAPKFGHESGLFGMLL